MTIKVFKQFIVYFNYYLNETIKLLNSLRRKKDNFISLRDYIFVVGAIFSFIL